MSEEKLAVYTIIESKDEEKKNFWQKVGRAFKNRDNSLTILLNALPVNGKLHVRKEKKREETENTIPF